MNALTIDIEEYFQVHNMAAVVRRDEWTGFDSRLHVGTDRVLAILVEADVKATFFILGWIAEQHPETVRKIHAQGHEVATHGYGHQLVYEQTPEQFRADLGRSIDLLEAITGEKILGYRAPSFSIWQDSVWALDILQEFGLRYDTSIYPAAPLVHSRYGWPEAPKAPYEIRPGLVEFPMTVVPWLGRDFPIGGGGWFRHYPYFVTRAGLRKVNRAGRPVMVYLHPWELDPDQPRINTSRYKKYLHYHNLDKTADRLKNLVRDFEFAPIRDVLKIEG